MSPENFVYWLNGFFEISGSETLSKEQVQVLKEHLKLVLTKKTNTNITTITQSPLIDAIPCNTPIDLSKGPSCSSEVVSQAVPTATGTLYCSPNRSPMKSLVIRGD